jgi:hypothetical protein
MASVDAKGRSSGLRRALLGLALFVPGLIVFLVARDWLLTTFGRVEADQVTVHIPKPIALIIGGPMAVGYALLVTGLYRAVFGTRGHALTAGWSLFRIAFGLVVTLGFVVVAFMIMAALR